LNLIEAIRVSCNPFLYKHALRCGPSPLCEEAKRFHLHEPTGIDLPFETKRMIVPSQDWKKRHLYEAWMPGDTANLSIGQGFLRVTPLQMACFAASFGRNETRTRPFLKIPERPPEKVSQPPALDTPYYRELVRGMEASVESGSCRMTRLDGVRIAGKSSTSQVQIKGQSSFKHIAWFIGFAPVENPQIALSVMIEQTHLEEPFWGSKRAVPVARDIFNDVFKSHGDER
jgi:penicillin-binding protein 2